MALNDLFTKDVQELEQDGILFSTLGKLVALGAAATASGRRPSAWPVARLK